MFLKLKTMNSIHLIIIPLIFINLFVCQKPDLKNLNLTCKKYSRVDQTHRKKITVTQHRPEKRKLRTKRTD